MTEEDGWLLGGDVDRISVSLRVGADDLDPSHVSSLLGCQPTRAWKKGEVRPGKRAPGRRNTGMWLLETAHVPGAEFNDAIRTLLARCSSDLGTWRSLQEKARIDLFCGVHLEEWNRGLELEPDVLALLSDRGLKLSLDIYGNSVDEENDEPWKA